MVPSYFISLKEIPLTANGKVDRKALPEPDEIPSASGTDYIAPQTPMEKKLVEIWQKVLGGQVIDINENFFRMGGDSVKAIQLASRMNKEGYKVEMRDIFLYPSISKLAPNIRKLERICDQAAVVGSVPLTPIQKRFFQEVKKCTFSL